MTAANVVATAQQSLNVQRVVPSADSTSSGSYRNLSLASLIPSQSYSSLTSPDSTEAWGGHVALAAGAATIDLTNLTMGAETINLAGKRLREIHIVADAINSAPISIGTGASNGYAEIGVVSNLKPGNADLRHCVNAAAVGSTNKTLDLAGTGTDGLSIVMVFGS